MCELIDYFQQETQRRQSVTNSMSVAALFCQWTPEQQALTFVSDMFLILNKFHGKRKTNDILSPNTLTVCCFEKSKLILIPSENN